MSSVPRAGDTSHTSYSCTFLSSIFALESGIPSQAGKPLPPMPPNGESKCEGGNAEQPAVAVRPPGPFWRRLLPPAPCREKKKRFFSLSILCFKFVGHLSCTNCKSNSTLDTLVGVGIRAFLCQPYLYYFFFFLSSSTTFTRSDH